MDRHRGGVLHHPSVRSASAEDLAQSFGARHFAAHVPRVRRRCSPVVRLRRVARGMADYHRQRGDHRPRGRGHRHEDPLGVRSSLWRFGARKKKTAHDFS